MLEFSIFSLVEQPLVVVRTVLQTFLKESNKRGTVLAHLRRNLAECLGSFSSVGHWWGSVVVGV